MAEIRIVEYRPELAAAVADMWTESMDNWGGGSAVRTEEEVRQQEANSSNLNLYIAMDGEKAVGYCGLSEFQGDEGVLYIPLLNVHPDYHGRKIGKKLVLTALERTIELGWPRLDLHTWPGNTKAVPLYKKCGFFWEERDETTHLMNFIPAVLATEAVKEFFKKTDWYKDSTRKIEVKPDGKKENGFDYFEYSWEAADGEKLRMQFERKGRGIRLIETDDYLISATVDNLKRVAGGTYPIRYEIVNKSGKPLEVSLTGVDDKNIMFTGFAKNLKVEDRETVEGSFKVGEIEEEQDLHKTHPTVTTKVKINGKEALFKTGIMPKYPANLTIQVPATQTFTGVPSNFYLEIENNVPESATFSFTLPESLFLHLDEREFQAELQPKEKRSISVPYQLEGYGFYDPKVDFTVVTKSGESLSFTKKVTAAFKGIGARFSGESDDYWHIYNGLYHVVLEKRDNLLFPGRRKEGEGASFFFYPKLGKPFSDEFSRTKPDSVDFFEEKGAIGLKATFRSQAFQGIELVSNVRLYGEGIVEQWYEIKNLSEEATPTEIWLYNWIFHKLYRPVFSYENQLIGTDNEHIYEYWESDKVTENWIFSRHDDIEPHGLCWSPDYKVRFDDWHLFFEHHFGKLEAGHTIKTKPTVLSIGAFYNWREFRAFALQQSMAETGAHAEDIQLNVNGNNPVVSVETSAVLKESKSTYLKGEVTLKAGDETIGHEAFTAADKIKHVNFDIHLQDDRRLHLLNLEAKLAPEALKQSKLVLLPNGGQVKTAEIEKEGRQSFEADNGVISLKVAPDFFPSLYSLESDGHEWLHHSFPETIAKSWWNPWPGGLGNHFSDINSNSLAKESHSARFTTLKDNHGNEWSGIAVSTEMKEHEDYKGLRFTQYFLMLPGVPIVCHTSEISQNTGRYFHMKRWNTDAFLNADWVMDQSRDGEWKKFAVRQSEIEVFVNRSLVYGCEDRKEKLQVAADFDVSRTSFYLNKDVSALEINHKVNLEHGQRLFTKPTFLILTEEIFPSCALQDLKDIRFS